MEEWRTISGIDGYEASNLGNVRSLDKTIIVNNHGSLISRTRRGKVLKSQKRPGKYPYMSVSCNYKKHYVHRLVAMAFLPNPQDKPHVNHIDGDKTNNLLSNIEWNTVKENNDHARVTGSYPPGYNASKLSNEQVVEIRRLYKTGRIKQVALARQFNVSARTISGIVNFQYRVNI